MKFDLRHIRYFIAVAEELHFRRAADRLGVAQPALSRAISFLEKELGVILLKRDNRNVEITPAGEFFLKSSHNTIASIERGIEIAKLVDQGKTGLVRIGYTDNAMSGCLPGLLKDFRQQHPDIELEIQHEVSSTQLSKLTIEELDIGIVNTLIDRPGFDHFPIQRENFVCVVYENHPLATRKSVRLEDLSKEKFIHGPPKEWGKFYSSMIPLFKKANYTPNIVQEAHNTVGILGLVASKMGITILTENVRNTLRPDLVILPIENIDEKMETYAIWRSNDLEGSKKIFVEFLSSISFEGDKPA